MKKRIMVVAIIAIVAAGSASAAFDGLTSVGLNYEFRDGVHMGGLSSQTFGYIDNCPVGYLVSVDADFNLGEDSMAIGMLVGPSYRYMFANVPMSVDLAVGASLSGRDFKDKGLFGLGVGGYLGATYYLNDVVALLFGCNIGYDMLGVDLDTGDVGFSGDFSVAPSLSVGFRY